MDIKLVNAGYPPRESSPVGRASSAKPELLPGGSVPGAPVTEVDEIQLTPGSLSLRQMETQSNESPIDEAKVASLRDVETVTWDVALCPTLPALSTALAVMLWLPSRSAVTAR